MLGRHTPCTTLRAEPPATRGPRSTESLERRRAMATGTNTKWEGRWDQLKGAVKKTWGQITDDDLKKVEGDYDRTVGMIKERTGEAMESIQKKIDGCCHNC